MNAPILVSDALKLLSMAIEDCDKASNGPWEADEIGHGEGCPRVTAFGGDMSLADIRGWGYLSSTRKDKQIAMDEQAGNMRFMPLARATMRPMLIHLRLLAQLSEEAGVSYFGVEEFAYPPIAALRVHYDQTRPDWRTK